MSLEQEFLISSEMTDQTLTIRIRGELDADTAPRLSDVLAAHIGVHQLVVDLAGCDFVDSSGISELLECRRQLGATARVRIEQVAPRVLRTFTIAGLLDEFEVTPA
jgi:anti-anti-sigma factor